MKYKVLKDTMSELTEKANQLEVMGDMEVAVGNVSKCHYHRGMTAGIRLSVAMLNDRKGL